MRDSSGILSGKGHQFLGIAVLVILLAIWEGLSRGNWVASKLLPPMSACVRTFYELIVSGVIPAELISSLGRVLVGFGLAILIMVPLGAFIGVSKSCRETVQPVIDFARTLPPPAMIPVAMIFLGIGEPMKIVVIVFACAFPILINTIDGFAGVPPTLVNTGRSFHLNRLEMARKVLIPYTSPYILSGMRISLPISLIMVIVSEMIGSMNGIGRYILLQQRSFHIREMYAGIITVALVGYGLNRVLLLIDRWFLDWHRESSSKQW